MTELYWIIANSAVFLAAVLQAATGVGLGMIVGPALILVMGSKSAIQVAIILNLSLSILLLPGEVKEIHWPSLKTLVLGTVIGMPIGLLLLSMLDLTGLKLFAAITVSLLGAQLILNRYRQNAAGADREANAMILPGASIASGIMTSSLAMPGPVAMWALARKGIKAEQIRATLRGLFVISYALALLAHALRGMDWSLVIDSSLDLGIALAAGTAIGFLVKRRLPGWVLSNLLLGMLLVMGLSLFVKSMFEIFEYG
jgi:uncharacterized membrane protein YfcA